MGVSSSLNALENSPVKPSGSGPLCVRSFLINALILSAVISPFRLSASTSLSFGRLYFSRNCPFHLGFQIFWHIIFITISYNPLYFCGISCNLSCFIADCVYLSHLSFCLSEPP